MQVKLSPKLAANEIDPLLIESDHRTSNSLQLLSAVMRMRAHHSKDPAARDAFLEANRRILCIGRLHRNLCSRAGHETLPLDDYLLDLRDDFVAAFLCDRPIELIVNADPILVDHSFASTIGLAMNELVTNAVKYGDMGDRVATIDVSCGSLDENTIELKVVNDVPARHDTAGDGCAAGVGTKILRALIARYAGKLKVEREGHRIVHTMTLSIAS